MASEIENDRYGVNITVLIPMRDLAKLKILEVSAISWQYSLEPGVPTTFFVLGLMSAIGPEMTGYG